MLAAEFSSAPCSDVPESLPKRPRHTPPQTAKHEPPRDDDEDLVMSELLPVKLSLEMQDVSPIMIRRVMAPINHQVFLPSLPLIHL